MMYKLISKVPAGMFVVPMFVSMILIPFSQSCLMWGA